MQTGLLLPKKAQHRHVGQDVRALVLVELLGVSGTAQVFEKLSSTRQSTLPTQDELIGTVLQQCFMFGAETGVLGTRLR